MKEKSILGKSNVSIKSDGIFLNGGKILFGIG